MITVSSAFQRLSPRHANERMEGVAYSSCGRLLAVATSESNRVLLFRRRAVGEPFDPQPYLSISAGVDYPHDASFSPDPGSRFLAVAQRGGSLLVLERAADDSYGPEPAVVIGGPGSGLDFSDGVAFLPPGGEYLAACNVNTNSVCFYRNHSSDTFTRFDAEPCVTLTNHAIDQPDGMAFSACGGFLALANHGGQSVAVFRRREGGGHIFDPQPMLIIRDSAFRFPHSVAFSSPGNHLLVTNAGANYFGAYCCNRYGDNGQEDVSWSREASVRTPLVEDDVFREANCANELEGGPKGIAVHGGEAAVCSPEAGIKLFHVDDTGPVRSREPVFALADHVVPTKADDWSRDRLDGDTVLRHEREPRRLRLNESAAAVWQLCNGERTVGEMIALLRPLAGAAASVDSDVKRTIELFDSHGLLSFRR